VIEFVRGTIDYVSPQYIVIDNGGIGYQIFTPNPFIYKKEMEVTIYTYHHVREDASNLYGFQMREEKILFTKLLNVTGIGPKGALAIMAGGDPATVVSAIENEDETFLVKFPGIGKKTARQIILDLKGKLSDVSVVEPTDLFTHEEHEKRAQNEASLDEALEALRVLGYAEREIHKVLPSLKEDLSLSTDQFVKKALKKLLK
jgi:Holliday junction DNA helicase RuvA